jgi:hypothetical protein
MEQDDVTKHTVYVGIKVDRYPNSLYVSAIVHAVYKHEEIINSDKDYCFLSEHTFGAEKVDRVNAPKDFVVTLEQASIFLLPNCKLSSLGQTSFSNPASFMFSHGGDIFPK